LPLRFFIGGGLCKTEATAYDAVMKTRKPTAPPPELSLYVVFCDPSDYPGQYVIRRQVVTPSGAIEHDPQPLCVGRTLGYVRMFLPPGLTRMNRDPNDEPQIVEVWI
jgi:hypothetical protein